MPWWGWMLLGMLLLGGEMATPGGFYLIFFAAGAIVLGLVGLADVALPVWLQWLAFSGISIGALVLLRPRILGRLREPGSSVGDEIVGEEVVVLEALAPGAHGRGELRGTTWTVANEGSTALAAGHRCRVRRVEGLVLVVSKEA